MSGSEPSLLWYDLETFGTDSAVDPIAQVAWCRTNLALEPIEAPQSIYCQPPWYCLPDPQASLVTGLTPQQCVRDGVTQRHFADQLLAQLARPETTSAGYNAIRFDDEFVRHLLWRELLDPYAREWQNGNQRFDLLDVVRLTYALRPEGIHWPQRDDGRPSFKLEHLVTANNLPQPRAHDAISDVQATIALAQLVQAKQPKLYAWARRMADKRVARDLLSFDPATPVVHVSGRYAAERGCLATVLPLGKHPGQANKIAVFDLSQDPEQWAQVEPEQLVAQLYAPRDSELVRPAIKFVHVGRCPMLAPMSVLQGADLERIQLNLEQCHAHAKALAQMPELRSKLVDALASERDWGEAGPPDPEFDLYGGFVSGPDRGRLHTLRADPNASFPRFDDARLDELAWRWCSRVSGRMDNVDAPRWQQIARQRLEHGARKQPPFEQWCTQLAELRQRQDLSASDSAMLEQLLQWGDCAARKAGLSVEMVR